MKPYHQFTLIERETLYGLLQQGKTYRYAAHILHRSHTSIAREVKRNRKYGNEYLGNVYIPCKAQRCADTRKEKQRRKAPLKHPAVFLYVREHLRMGWSPELIAGRLSHEYQHLSICPETIYRYVYSKRTKTRGMHLEQYLTLRRKKRMKKSGRTVHRYGRIPEAISIEKRPKSIATRKTIGHWETDNVLGKQKDKTVLSVTVERTTRFTLLTKLHNKKATTKADALINRLHLFPSCARQSLTADNGLENIYHQRITQETGMPVYFCHAYHSWEKGTVENMNGRIRRYLPKGMSLDTVSTEVIQTIEDILNATPRKCLNYRTPREMMAKLRVPTEGWCTSR